MTQPENALKARPSHLAKVDTALTGLSEGLAFEDCKGRVLRLMQTLVGTKHLLFKRSEVNVTVTTSPSGTWLERRWTTMIRRFNKTENHFNVKSLSVAQLIDWSIIDFKIELFCLVTLGNVSFPLNLQIGFNIWWSMELLKMFNVINFKINQLMSNKNSNQLYMSAHWY